MRKKVGIIKRVSCIGLIFLLSINSFAAIVSDNDGSAFITKAEFDALKSSFQSQIDSYNASIDSKIDGAIASYLAGIKLSTETEIPNTYNDLVTTAINEGYTGVFWSGVETTSFGDADTDIYPSMDMRIFSLWGTSSDAHRYGWIFSPYLKKTYKKVVLDPAGDARWAGISEMIYTINGTYVCGYTGTQRTSIDCGFPDHNLTGGVQYRWLKTNMEIEDETWGYNDNDTPFILTHSWRDDSNDKGIILAPLNNKNTIAIDEQIAGGSFSCGASADGTHNPFSKYADGSGRMDALYDNVAVRGNMYFAKTGSYEGQFYEAKGYTCSGEYANTTWWMNNRNFIPKSGLAAYDSGKNLEFKSYYLHYITNRTSALNFAKIKYKKIKTFYGQDASAATGLPICSAMPKAGPVKVTATFDYNGWALVYAKSVPDVTWGGNRTSETDTTSIKVTSHQVPKDTPITLTCDCEAGDVVYIVYVPNTGEDWTKLATLTIQQIVLITE